MMKKIFALVLLLVLGKMSYAQYPITQTLGSDSTIVISKGALQSRLINVTYLDTFAANNQRIRQYPGAQIATTTGGLNLWIRNANATAWIPVATGSGNNIYTIDGTLLGNRTLTGAGYSLTFNQLSKLLFNADSTTVNTDQATILNNGLSTLSVKGAGARTLLIDTTAPADERIYELKSSNGEFYISILNDAQTSNDSAFLITSASRVGINTLNPDSTLKVGGGVNILGGLRVGNLPTSPGTKQLRINAQGQLSVTDTLIDAGGTVTSVGTNNGSGITGGPITTTGTLAIDTTNVIATKASVSGGLAGKLNISDTAAMLAPYLRAIDTASLSNRINLKLNISDTATMLGNYLNNVGYGLSKAGQVASADSATLSAYYLRRKDSLTATNPLGYVTKKILSDTAAAIRSSDLGGTVTSVATNNGTGITGGTITTSGTLAIDTLLVSTRAWRQKGVDSVAALANTKISGSLISGYLTKATGSLTIDTSQIYQNGQNVGIGTIVPDGRLAIVDTGGFALKINYNSASTDANNNAALYAENNGLSSYVTIFNEKTTNNTGGQFPLLVESSLTSGTAQSGMATGIHFGVPDDAGNKKVTQLALRTTDPAAATYTNRAELRLWNNGSLSTPYYLLGNGNMGLGTSTPDSNLTVVNGALFQRGVRMSGLPTGTGTKSLRVDASGTVSIADTLANGVSGSLISGYLTKATGTNTIDTSQIYQSNGRIGVSTVTPQTRLMVAETASDGALSILGNPSNVATFKFYANNGSTIQSVVNSSSSAMQIGTFVNSEMNLITNSATRVSILNNGNVGIGSGAGTDSMLTVENGARFKRGVRMSGLPTAPGTKALRINASGTISIADTLIDAGGTVTSVATNTGTGITGGTITTSGTIAADTLLLSTRAWRQKGVDSVASLINTRISGTTNYIPKFTSSSAIGTGSLYDDGANIGLGTTATTAISGGYTGFFINGSSGSNIDFRAGGTGYGRVQADVNGLLFAGLNSVPITFFTGGSERLRISSTGNVSIGNTNNTYKLDVSGDITGRGAFNGFAGATQNLLIDWSAESQFTTLTATNLFFGTNATRRMTITSAGSVGIGTSTPAEKLDVYDNSASNVSIKVGNTSGALQLLQGNGAAYLYTATNQPLIFSNNNSEKMRLDASGNLYLNTTSGTGRLVIAQSNATQPAITLTTDESTIQGPSANTKILMGGNLSMYGANILTFGTGTTERARIDASGNLGLGTSVPEELLELSSSNTTGGQLLMESTGSSSGNYAGMRFKIAGGSNGGYEKAGIFAIRGSGGYNDLSLIFATNTAADATNVTSANEKMRLDASGNLGINNSSPAAKLDVQGSSSDQIRLRTAATEYYGIGRNSSTGYLDFYGSQSGYVGYLFGGVNGTRMTLDASGNLGLGVSPSGSWGSDAASRALQLDGGSVWGYSTSQMNILQNAVFNGSNLLYVNSATASAYRQISGVHSWYTAPSGTAGNAISFTQAMTLDASGNLGVGVTNPAQKLHIAGTSTSAMIVGNADGSSKYYQLSYNNGQANSRSWRLGNDVISYGDFAIQQSTTQTGSTFSSLLYVGSGGNVGIGTTSPSTKLDINAGSVSSDTYVARLMWGDASGTNKGLLGFFSNSGVDYRGFIGADNSGAFYLGENGGGGIRFLTGGPSGSERMRITSGGEILVNTTTDAGAYYLQVNGDVYAGAYYESSDRRLKDILSVRGGSDGINTVTFKWKDQRDSLSHIGYIAQEVEKVLPDAVKTNPNGYKTVNYDEVQTLKIANLEQEIAELKKIINQLIDKK